MRLIVNHKTLDFNGSTLTDLFNQFRLTPSKGFAVAVNDVVISKDEWASTDLEEGDSILIISPTQGG
jgi:sulfur carrier protein